MKIIRALQKEQVIWGPLFLLATFALSFKEIDLFLVAAAGLFLSAAMHIRGFCYFLVLLTVDIVMRHLFFTADHLWYLGIEASIAISCFIIALAFEQEASLLESLDSQIKTQSASYENLEEELARHHESAQELQIASAEKIAALQKELEDFESEHSSILILNEVLRKKTARFEEESKQHLTNLNALENQMNHLKMDYEAAQKELSRLENTDEMVALNTQLMQELGAAKCDKEQTHLINETFQRLHLKESLKAKEAEDEASSLKELLRAAHEEIRRIAEPMQQELDARQKKINALSYEFERTAERANDAHLQLQRFNDVQTERNFLKERLDAALQEINHLKRADQVDPELVEQLKSSQEKMARFAQFEPLYRQLKKQFEEKNQVLEQTRKDLFKSDTELQELKIEKEQTFSKELEEELVKISQQVAILEEENRLLQEIVSELSKEGHSV